MTAIIAITGLPGSGKSTLAHALAHHLGAGIIEYDQYQTVTDHPIESVIEWLNDDANYNALNIPGLCDDLARLKRGLDVTPPAQPLPVHSRPFIVFETPFGYCHAESAKHIDLMLWIDVPLDIALARNIRAFTEHFTTAKKPSSTSDNIHWLQEYLENYIISVHSMLAKQIQKVRPHADYIIEGNSDMESVCREALTIIQNWTHNPLSQEGAMR